MGLFKGNKKLKENYLIKNKIRWEVFFREGRYKFLTEFWNDVEPVELSIEELLELREELETFMETLNDSGPGFYELRQKTNNGKKLFTLYPKTYVKDLSGLLSRLIDEEYEEYTYLGDVRKIINSKDARYCEDPDCKRKDWPLEPYEKKYHQDGPETEFFSSCGKQK